MEIVYLFKLFICLYHLQTVKQINSLKHSDSHFEYGFVQQSKIAGQISMQIALICPAIENYWTTPYSKWKRLF